jgi:hypothetical protein
MMSPTTPNWLQAWGHGGANQDEAHKVLLVFRTSAFSIEPSSCDISQMHTTEGEMFHANEDTMVYPAASDHRSPISDER